MPVRKLPYAPPQAAGRVYVGIDPGINGGVAYVCGKALAYTRMPDTEMDLWNLVESIMRLAQQNGGFAYLEQQTPRPTMVFDHKAKKFRPTILKSTCLLYGNYRLLKGMLVAAGIPHEEPPPQRWQKALAIPPRKKGEGEREWKNRLKAKAQSLFPGAAVTLAVADALLLAEAARRSREGAAV